MSGEGRGGLVGWGAAAAKRITGRVSERLERQRERVEQQRAAAEGEVHQVERAVEQAEHRNEPPPVAAVAPAVRDPHGAPSFPALPSSPSEAVPWSLRVAAETIWRLLIVGAGIYVLFRVVQTLHIVAFAFIAALLISALLQPTVSRLQSLGLPRALAAAVTFVGGLIGIGLVGWFVGWQVSTNLGEVTNKVQSGIAQIHGWLTHGPFHLTDTQINQFAKQLQNAVGSNSDQITSFGFSTVGIVIEILTGVLLAAFCTFFLIYDGARIWGWLLKLFPPTARIAMAGAGPRAWSTLTAYVRGTVLVAFIDSVSIGIGIFLLGVPLALPVSVLIFLGAFVPLVGALVTGTIAVLIALVTKSVFTAAMVLVVLLAVQQIEGHLLQPLILGRAVRVHPIAVVLSVTVGSILGSIGGAIVAVPLVAVTNTTVGYLKARQRAGEDVRVALLTAQAEARTTADPRGTAAGETTEAPPSGS